MAVKITLPVKATAQAPADDGQANPWPPGTASHDQYKAGWNHAVHGHPKGDKKHPAHTKGVVHGLMHKRRNKGK